MVKNSFGVKCIEDITRWREDMNFVFERQERFLIRSLRSLVRYCSCHENIKFISSNHHVIFVFIIWRLNKRDARNQFNKSKSNLVPRVSLLCLPWSLEERPWLRLVTLPPRIRVAKNLLVGRGGRGFCLVDVTDFVDFKSSSSRL